MFTVGRRAQRSAPSLTPPGHRDAAPSPRRPAPTSAARGAARRRGADDRRHRLGRGGSSRRSGALSLRQARRRHHRSGPRRRIHHAGGQDEVHDRLAAPAGRWPAWSIWPIRRRDPTRYGEWKGGWIDFDGTSVQIGSVHGDPGRFVAGTGPELAYGDTLCFGDYRCRADQSGLFCVNYAHQSAVRFNSAGIVQFGCLRSVPAPDGIGIAFRC